MTYKVGILVASDSSYNGLRDDLCTPLMKEMILKQTMDVIFTEVVSDDLEVIKEGLIKMSNMGCDLIFTSGGTGFSPRDNTPEATRSIIQKEANGIASAMIYNSLKYTPRAMLSRAVAGIYNSTLIINLPGSPKAVKENLEFLLPNLNHALDVLGGNVKECATK
ncbi:MAG: molybdenum cofactor biosynthesis protein B [Anaerorhabdus sp.]